jgi:hypothetical protein
MSFVPLRGFAIGSDPERATTASKETDIMVRVDWLATFCLSLEVGVRQRALPANASTGYIAA